MTATGSASSATRARSWVMRTTAISAPSRKSSQQCHDLRLDGDVEGGGRLVGDQHRRVRGPPPWRSEGAGACRRRTGAGRSRPGSRARGCRRGPSARWPRLGPAWPTCPGGSGTPRPVGCPRYRRGSARSVRPGRRCASSGPAILRRTLGSAATRSTPSSTPSDRRRCRRPARADPTMACRRHRLAAAGLAEQGQGLTAAGAEG